MTPEDSVWIIVGIIFVGVLVGNTVMFITLWPNVSDSLCNLWDRVFKRVFNK